MVETGLDGIRQITKRTIILLLRVHLFYLVLYDHLYGPWFVWMMYHSLQQSLNLIHQWTAKFLALSLKKAFQGAKCSKRISAWRLTVNSRECLWHSPLPFINTRYFQENLSLSLFLRRLQFTANSVSGTVVAISTRLSVILFIYQRASSQTLVWRSLRWFARKMLTEWSFVV